MDMCPITTIVIRNEKAIISKPVNTIITPDVIIIEFGFANLVFEKKGAVNNGKTKKATYNFCNITGSIKNDFLRLSLEYIMK